MFHTLWRKKGKLNNKCLPLKWEKFKESSLERSYGRETTFKSVKPHKVQLNSIRLASKSAKQISELAQRFGL